MQISGIIIIAFMLATLLILIVGLVVMARGGKVSKKYSNKLMVLRVVFQAIAILLLAGLFFIGKN